MLKLPNSDIYPPSARCPCSFMTAWLRFHLASEILTNNSECTVGWMLGSSANKQSLVQLSVRDSVWGVQFRAGNGTFLAHTPFTAKHKCFPHMNNVLISIAEQLQPSTTQQK